MAVLPRLRQFLDRNHVAYTHHVHPTAYTAKEVAAAEHVPEHRVIKTVVFCCNEGYGLAVLPADYVVDLQELRLALGLARLRLATEKELAELFEDCELGAMPPFGTLYNLPTYMDTSLLAERTIAVNAGTHKDAVYIDISEYRRTAKPDTVHFSHAISQYH